MNVFLDDQDYKLFLSRLKENLYPSSLEDHHQGRTRSHTPYKRKLLPEGSFSVVSYCLMPNHFHLLVKQNTGISISKLISKISTSYSKCFNKKYARVGPVFQDEFKATWVDTNEYLLWLSAYIHLNPAVAKLAKGFADWEWSSYLEYMNFGNDRICDKLIIFEQFKDNTYKEFVESAFESILAKKDLKFELSDAEFESP